jgi:hypothetical protein
VELAGCSLNDDNPDLFMPFENLRAPYDNPTRRVGQRSGGGGAGGGSSGGGGDSWPPPPKQKDLFQPFTELDLLTLFKRLLESSPHMKLEEAQGCGFDLAALNETGNADVAQVDAVYFIHKDNGVRRQLEEARARSGGALAAGNCTCSGSGSGSGSGGGDIGGSSGGGGGDIGGGFDGKFSGSSNSYGSEQGQAAYQRYRQQAASASGGAAPAVWSNPLTYELGLPVEEIKEYFGDEIGFYFAFLRHFVRCLIPVAAVGAAVFLAMVLSPSGHLSAPRAQSCFALASLCWYSFMLFSWTRQEHDLAFRWDPDGVDSHPT